MAVASLVSSGLILLMCDSRLRIGPWGLHTGCLKRPDESHGDLKANRPLDLVVFMFGQGARGSTFHFWALAAEFSTLQDCLGEDSAFARGPWCLCLRRFKHSLPGRMCSCFWRARLARFDCLGALHCCGSSGVAFLGFGLARLGFSLSKLRLSPGSLKWVKWVPVRRVTYEYLLVSPYGRVTNCLGCQNSRLLSGSASPCAAFSKKAGTRWCGDFKPVLCQSGWFACTILVACPKPTF